MPSEKTSEIKSYLVPGKHAHLIGIGGVSMRPLGLVLRGMGLTISGSDMNASVSTEELVRNGIPVSIGHRAENIEGADCIIRTAAVHNDNPEIAAARAAGIPVFERAQAWGVIMQEYKNAVCVSGTHGKTTTTSMITQIFLQAGLDPTVMIGGSLPLLGAGHRVGNGDTIVMESCEYCNSFLNFYPTLALVLNVEADHLDFFKDLDDVKASFRKFAGLVPESGVVIGNGDDENTMSTLASLDRTVLTFGFTKNNNVHPENMTRGFSSFDIICNGQKYCHVDLKVIGRHNAYNALAAAAAAWTLGVGGSAVSEALSCFTGADRRLQYKGSYNGADIYDDYAHHPGELHMTLEAVKTLGYKRVICAFQPHTYTRTKALFDDFVAELRTVDIAVLAEIYAAREKNTVGVSANDLASLIDGAVFFETLPEVAGFLRETAQPGDLILTVGAGDIYRVADMLVK